MRDLLVSTYPWLKALHVFSVILWMAAQIALPLLLMVHRQLSPTSSRAVMLADIERQLIRRVMNPAILAAFTFGGLMVYTFIATAGQLPAWLGIKLVLVLLLSAVHGLLAREYKRILTSGGRWSDAAWRRVHWMDIGMLAAVVALVIHKPVF